MLQKLGHFNSRLAFEMQPRQKCPISRIFQKNWGGSVQSICLRNWALLVANRGSKLTNCWGDRDLRTRPGMLQKWTILVRD